MFLIALSCYQPYHHSPSSSSDLLHFSFNASAVCRVLVLLFFFLRNCFVHKKWFSTVEILINSTCVTMKLNHMLSLTPR